MPEFEILFDQAEAAPGAGFGSYGRLGFPAPPAGRPWIFSNFVQSLDGIVSFEQKGAATSDLSQSQADRWLMDLLRAHADTVLLGVNTLVEEAHQHSSGRGFVYRIQDEELRAVRKSLGRGREKNIFVTGAASLDLSQYRVFDGEHVDAFILTTDVGAKRLAEKRTHPHVRVLVAGQGKNVDLAQAMALLRRELKIEYLLCEGGPTLHGYLQRAGLVDEMFLTTSPVLLGQKNPESETPRPNVFTGAPGFGKDDAAWWRWMSSRRSGDHMFNRYRRR
ncbi:MAG TPA: dihydrofolate reductase family protein [Terriglobales bacterium]|nr:dihydrofolate reductase family protein [Terriglobales bacterium]